MMTVRQVLAVVGFAALALVADFGCYGGSRSGTAHVEGTITIDGQPLPADAQVSITFRPMSGGRSAGAVVTNGTYVCQDAPIGKVKVFPSIERRTGRMLSQSDNVPYPEMASIIASIYAQGIDVEIAGSNSTLDFDLEPAEP